MGGCGSGNYCRWSTQTTLEETRRLKIAELKKYGALQPGTARMWNWNCGGEPSGSIQIHTKEYSLLLKYKARSHGNEEWQSIEQTIMLDHTPCNYGGTRKWFICPHCQKRVGVLAGHSTYFYCRKCYQLPYATTRESDYDRLLRKREKLASRIFEDGEKYKKKKGLHYKTFNRLFNEYINADAACDSFLERYLNKFDPTFRF